MAGTKCCGGTCRQCCDNGDCSSSNCQVCQGGVCVSTCAGGKVCVNGVCKKPCNYSSDCDSEKCEACVNGYCALTCSPDDCEHCNGAGNCVTPCDTNACNECDGQGNCVSACDPCACKECDGAGNCFITCNHNECKQCDGLGHCVSFCDLNCQECNGYGSCIDILVTSISSDITIACVECSIHFEATAVPEEQEDKIRWSAPGGDPNSGSGASFSTNWARPGSKTVTARICDSSKSKDVTIVGVDKIQVYAEASWQEVTDCNMVVLQGTKYTFKALPAPQGAGWPSGPPIWSGAASGSGETIEATFATGGAKTLTAKCGTCGEPGKSVNIEVILPEPNQVSFVDNNPGEEHDIYGITDPVWTQDIPTSSAASYTMGKYVKMESQFWAEKGLTFATEVDIAVNISGWPFNDVENVTFKNWPSDMTEHISAGPLYDYIGYGWGYANWSYKVPSGTDQWIYMSPVTGPHTIYWVYGAQQCNDPNYTENHLYYACGWGSGGIEVAEDDIPKKIQENCWLNFDWKHLSDPWDLETTGGDCQTHAELMAEALKVLGISADGTNASTCRVGETRNCPTHGLEYHCFVETNPGATGTNFEGVCEVYLIDEGTPWYCYYDKAMGEIGGDPAYQKGSHTNMWTEWNNCPPPNYKVIHHFTNWKNH